MYHKSWCINLQCVFSSPDQNPLQVFMAGLQMCRNEPLATGDAEALLSCCSLFKV